VAWAVNNRVRFPVAGWSAGYACGRETGALSGGTDCVCSLGKIMRCGDRGRCPSTFADSSGRNEPTVLDSEALLTAELAFKDQRFPGGQFRDTIHSHQVTVCTKLRGEVHCSPCSGTQLGFLRHRTRTLVTESAGVFDAPRMNARSPTGIPIGVPRDGDRHRGRRRAVLMRRTQEI